MVPADLPGHSADAHGACGGDRADGAGNGAPRVAKKVGVAQENRAMDLADLDLRFDHRRFDLPAAVPDFSAGSCESRRDRAARFDWDVDVKLGAIFSRDELRWEAKGEIDSRRIAGV